MIVRKRKKIYRPKNVLYMYTTVIHINIYLFISLLLLDLLLILTAMGSQYQKSIDTARKFVTVGYAAWKMVVKKNLIFFIFPVVFSCLQKNSQFLIHAKTIEKKKQWFCVGAAWKQKSAEFLLDFLHWFPTETPHCFVYRGEIRGENVAQEERGKKKLITFFLRVFWLVWFRGNR